MKSESLRRLALPMLTIAFAWNCNLSDPGGKDARNVGPTDTVAIGLQDTLSGNHAPSIGLGSHNVSMGEGESKTIVLTARDEDGDAVRLLVQNLDSLRSLFPDDSKAIDIVSGGDSLLIGFLPGRASGNYRFRIAAMDDRGGIDVQVLTISVGKVNHPPEVTFAPPADGTAFKIKEGQTLILNVVVEDQDGGTATRLDLDKPPWPRFGEGRYDPRTGSLTFTPSFGAAASGETTLSELVFRARDKGDPPETGEISARITVQDSNSAPKWKTSRKTLEGREGEAMGIDLAPLFLGDGEGDAVEFSASCGSVDGDARVKGDAPMWSYTPGFRDAGSKECVIRAADSHRPPAQSDLTLVLAIADNSRRLDVAITSPGNGFVTRDTVVPVEWTVDGKLRTGETSEVLETEGENVIRRSFLDSLGNAGSDSIVVIRDTHPPVVVIESPLPGLPIAAAEAEVIWTVDGERQTSQTREPLDGVGPVRIRREALDAAGNRGADSVLIIHLGLPVAAPRVEGPAAPSRNPEWTWSSRDLAGSGTYRIGWRDGEWFDTLDAERYAAPGDLPDGPLTLFVSEQGDAGNWSDPGSFQVTLDRLPPGLRITAPDPAAGATSADPVVAGEAEDANGLAVVRFETGFGSGTAVLAGNAWSIAGLSYPDGDQTITVTADDAAGNASDPATVVVHKRSHTVFVRAGGSGRGTSWNDAYGSLFQALSDPSGTAGLKVWAADGEFSAAAGNGSPLVVPSDVELYGGFPADGSGLSVSDRNVADPRTLIRCDISSGSHAVLMQGNNSLLDGFRFEGSGGAVAGAGGNTVRNCLILNTGGADPVRVAGPKGSPFVLEAVRIEGNRTADRAALFIDPDARVEMTNVSISGNYSGAEGSGGGIWLGEKAKATCRGCLLSGNSAAWGGAPRLLQAHVEPRAELDYEGIVDGGMAGFDISPRGKATLNGVASAGG